MCRLDQIGGLSRHSPGKMDVGLLSQIVNPERSRMTKLVDIHCHLVPYVDDGAYDLNTAEALLREQVRQGVETICLTPHLRKGMFETDQSEIDRQVDRLRELVREAELPLRLYDSREYHFDEGFLRCLTEGRLKAMGEGKTLLVEFGRRHRAENMFEAIRLCREAGFQPLIAHVERYEPTRQDSGLAEKLLEQGAKLQVNAGSLLGWEGLRQKWLAHRLVRQGLVAAVASDAHDLEGRKPNLADCAALLTRKYGQETAERLLCTGPMALIKDQ